MDSLKENFLTQLKQDLKDLIRRGLFSGMTYKIQLGINLKGRLQHQRMNEGLLNGFIFKNLNTFPVSSTVNPPDIAIQKRGKRYFTSIFVLAVKQFPVNCYFKIMDECSRLPPLPVSPNVCVCKDTNYKQLDLADPYH